MSYSLPGLVVHPIEGEVLDVVMFSTVFCVAHCPWPWTGEGETGCVMGIRSWTWTSKGNLPEFHSKESPRLAGEEWGAGRWEIREGIYQR